LGGTHIAIVGERITIPDPANAEYLERRRH
jgi:hypothetical protein